MYYVVSISSRRGAVHTVILISSSVIHGESPEFSGTMVKKGGKKERSMAILHYIPVKLAKLLKPDLPQIATNAIRSSFLMTPIIYPSTMLRL